jgi:glucosamine 6-phosphate synthetase-like amidotransferase/phosphosugar isomerase protein
MCGIAGYSLSPDSSVERTLAAQALLAGIAERGADAVGYAYRTRGAGPAEISKQRTGASELLDRIAVPQDATQLLVHVRDYTKGHPSIAANNHPVRHGRVVGIHNGLIVNDDEILARFPCARSEPGMTVDTEAIFAVAEHSGGDPRALEELRGAMATAWVDEGQPDVVHLARGTGRPLWIGIARGALFFASTKLALEVAERYLELPLRKQELKTGTHLLVRDGDVVVRTRFTPDHEFVEENPLPAVRAPREAEFCLSRLDALAYQPQ